MNILCIPGDYIELPSNNLMNKSIMIALINSGHNVSVVTFKNKDYYNEVVNSEIYQIKGKKKLLRKLQNSFLRLPYLLWQNIISSFFIRPYDKADLSKIDLSKVDVLLLFCPPPISVLIGSDLFEIFKKSKKKIKCIQYWTDPLSIGMLNKIDKIPLKRFFHKIVENEMIKFGDDIVYCSPILLKAQQEIFPKYAHKMRWADIVLFTKSEIENSKKINNPVKLGYFGSFYKSVRDLIPLVDCVSTLHDVNLVIRGDSDIKFYELPSNIDLKVGRLPFVQIQEFEDDVDILICIGNLGGVQIPGKVFYYMNYNKPVIYVSDGYFKSEIEEYLKSFDRFNFCDNNVESIKIAITSVVTNLPKFNLDSKPEFNFRRISDNIL